MTTEEQIMRTARDESWQTMKMVGWIILGGSIVIGLSMLGIALSFPG